MDTISRKVSRALLVLKHAKQFYQTILKNLYISIIEPHLDIAHLFGGFLVQHT